MKFHKRTSANSALVEIRDNDTNQLIAVTDDNGTHADLLAAAPELLAVIPRLIAVINDFMPNVGRCALQNYQELNEAPIAARAAIARATGV